MNWVGTVYHGLPRDLLTYGKGRGKYLAFLGRISPEKRPDLAIDIACKAGIPIKLAAKVDVADRAYFDQVIKPRLSLPGVEYIGEINESQKNEFLGNALALMFTIEWPEPFGFTMIEALACGTPVIARPCGCVPEVLRNGVSGLIATEFDDLVKAVKNIESISRAACRKEFETRFTADVMAAQYECIFQDLISSAQRNGSSRHASFEERRLSAWGSAPTALTRPPIESNIRRSVVAEEFPQSGAARHPVQAGISLSPVQDIAGPGSGGATRRS
jgi:glycogen synthase